MTLENLLIPFILGEKYVLRRRNSKRYFSIKWPHYK